MRADMARQMAAGDWMEALGVADARSTAGSPAAVSPGVAPRRPAGLDEVQTVTITGTPTGGTFTLTYDGQTTAAIAYNATAATVKSALAALSNIKAEDITTAGGPGPGTPYTVTFGGGATDGRNVPQMTATGSLTGGTTPAVAVTTTTGGGGAITVQRHLHRLADLRQRDRGRYCPASPTRSTRCCSPPARGCSSTAAPSTWAWCATPP
jgi:hypothetical protein